MSEQPLPKWETTKSEYVVNDRWLTLRADTCVTPDGRTITPWYVKECPDWVNCLVVDKNENVILLQHYRHGINDYVTEIPAGTVDPTDASPEAAITRELSEEIGYRNGEIFPTASSFANPSSQNNRVFSFVAVICELSGTRHKELGADFVVKSVPFEQLVREVERPNPPAGWQNLHLAAISFAFNFIRYTKSPTPAVLRLREILRNP